MQNPGSLCYRELCAWVHPTLLTNLSEKSGPLQALFIVGGVWWTCPKAIPPTQYVKHSSQASVSELPALASTVSVVWPLCFFCWKMLQNTHVIPNGRYTSDFTAVLISNIIRNKVMHFFFLINSLWFMTALLHFMWIAVYLTNLDTRSTDQ